MDCAGPNPGCDLIADALLVTQWRASDGYRFYWRLWNWHGGPVVTWSKTYTR